MEASRQAEHKQQNKDEEVAGSFLWLALILGLQYVQQQVRYRNAGKWCEEASGVSLQIFQVHSLSSSKLLLFTLDSVTVVLKVEEVDVLRAL